jgi:phosphatidylglycerophosphate synthase
MAASGSFADRIVGAFAAPFVALRVPPNWITVLGGLLILIPAAFAADGRYLWAGLTLGFVAMMDTVDGHVARATNRTTPFGGFLDSVIDRVSDGIILIGIGLGTDGSARWWAVLGAGLIGPRLRGGVAPARLVPPAL